MAFKAYSICDAVLFLVGSLLDEVETLVIWVAILLEYSAGTLPVGNCVFGFRAPVPGYQMDGYIRAS